MKKEKINKTKKIGAQILIICFALANVMFCYAAKKDVTKPTPSYSSPSNTDLSQAYAYPSPFKPSLGHKEIIFTNLSDEGTIKIYTISGELVKTINYKGKTFTQSWDVRNESGKKLASGVYIYHIESANDKKDGKIVVIR
jgi:hypothetical protein